MKKVTQALIIGFAVMVGAELTACAATPTNESTGQYVDSSATTAKVKSTLLNTQGLNSTSISVETYKGVVQLSGFVDSKAQSQLAEQTAASVPGVNKVKNDLVVKSAAQN
jgi:osmotically-inducible protein OsmY